MRQQLADGQLQLRECNRLLGEWMLNEIIAL